MESVRGERAICREARLHAGLTFAFSSPILEEVIFLWH